MNRHPDIGSKLRVRVGSTPDPLLLPAALSARVAGRAFPPGPEDEVARAVAAAVRGREGERGRDERWR